MTAPNAATKRAAIVAKVRKLMDMTTKNGASEAEAMKAASVAARLMAEHDLTYDDIETEVRSEKFGRRERPVGGKDGRKRMHEVQTCLLAIAHFFDCRAWRGEGNRVVFFGSETDTEAAHAMADMMQAAMDIEFHRYLKGSDRPADINGRTLRANFMPAMARRISERLNALKAERTAADRSARGSTALVVVKGAVVDEKFNAWRRQNAPGLPPNYGKHGCRGYSKAQYHSGARDAGRRAGDRVDIGQTKIDGVASG